jgi:hypothetical protein
VPNSRRANITFNCNVCNQANSLPIERFDRESPTCKRCSSNVRIRSLLHALSIEVFGVSLPLSVVPRVKSLRCLGLSDVHSYAELLTQKFDYRNTSYTDAPRLDITAPPQEELGKYDIVIASEIFEHVYPPVERAFRGAFNLLRPNGLLLMTMPYSIDAASIEHYPNLRDFSITQIGGESVVVARNASGKIQVFENPVFHLGRDGPALEMREISESDMREGLVKAGFGEVRICREDYEPFGILHREGWSLPVIARKGSFILRQESIREMAEEWAALHKLSREWAGNRWVRFGAKAGLVDLSSLERQKGPRN